MVGELLMQSWLYHWKHDFHHLLAYICSDTHRADKLGAQRCKHGNDARPKTHRSIPNLGRVDTLHHQQNSPAGQIMLLLSFRDGHVLQMTKQCQWRNVCSISSEQFIEFRILLCGIPSLLKAVAQV